MIYTSSEVTLKSAVGQLTVSTIVPNSGGDLWWFAVICGGLRWFGVVCLLVISILDDPLALIGNSREVRDASFFFGARI